MFNTIRITIYSYREEIGIMKLVGATNWFIRSPFLLESIFLGGLGTIIGLLLGLVLAVFAKLITYGLAVFSATQWTDLAAWIGIAFVIGTGLSVVGALYPAHRASRMQPVEAMRVTQ